MIAIPTRSVAEAAWLDLHRNAPPSLRRRYGVRVSEGPDGHALHAPGLPHVFFNRGYSDRGAEGWAAQFGDVDTFWVHTERGGPGPPDPERFPRDWDVYRRPIHPDERWNTHGVRRARSEDRHVMAYLAELGFDFPAGAGDLIVSAFGRTRWGWFIAERCGQVAGFGAAYARGDSVYMAMAVVAPQWRGDGIQRTLFGARLAWARDLGCRVAVSETGQRVRGEANPSGDNMRRMGFRVVGGVSNYGPPDARW